MPGTSSSPKSRSAKSGEPKPKSKPKSRNKRTSPIPDDPHRWLESIETKRVLTWARGQNARSQGELEADPSFRPMRERIRAVLDSKEKTPYVSKRGSLFYNFWRDDKHVRGLLRRTTLTEFRKAKPKWETVLDLDFLAAKENESWVFAGNAWLHPSYDRVLVTLSRGGSDASVIREFDVTTKRFVVKDGFTLPEAKSEIAWKDRDTLYVATDFGAGSLTDSGYPRIVKEWKRGTPLSEAVTIYEIPQSEVKVVASRSWDHGVAYDTITRVISFFASETLLRGSDGSFVKLDIPVDAEVGIWNGQLLVTLRSNWKIGKRTWPQGAMIVTSLASFLDGKRDFTMLFEPKPNKSLEDVVGLASGLVFNELEDIQNRLYVWTRSARGAWSRKPFDKAAGAAGTTTLWSVESAGESDAYWIDRSGYTTPSTLSLGTLGGTEKVVKRSPAFFDAKGLVVEQHFAKSADGTRVPYFQISRAKLVADGSHPTVLYGYGGFEVSMTPGYDPVSGLAWLERGGVYVVANIRGGGEYGPAWHQAALRGDRQRAYDDFIAVAEDLIRRKITTSDRLGISGGSNGGLLTGVMLTQRPELFGAVVSAMPLLDMRRYHELLSGASWMDEYGDPDKPADWAAIAKYSPYHNVKQGVRYPRSLFLSSTRDDRVHPGHARKMVARMLEQGHDNVLYYENIEGGHGGAANNEQAAFIQALEYTFLAKVLGLTAA